MRLRNRTTRQLVDAHWELDPGGLDGSMVLIADFETGQRRISKHRADGYILMVATLEELRIGIDNGYRFSK